MSVILDALRKSQQEHDERGPVLMLVPRSEPELESDHRRWPWVTAGALGVGAVVLATGYWYLGLPLRWPDVTLVAEAPTTVPPAPETVPLEPSKPIDTAAAPTEPTATTTAAPIVEPAASPTVAAMPPQVETAMLEPVARDQAPEPVTAPEPAETIPAVMPFEPVPAPVQQVAIAEPAETAVQTPAPVPPTKPERLSLAPAAETPAAGEPVEEPVESVETPAGDEPVAEPEKAVAAPEEIAEQPAEAVVVAALPPDPYENLPILWSLPSSFQNSVPRLDISVHYYTADARRRMVFVNGEKFREGDELAPGLTLDAITPNAIVLSYNGTQFQVARP